MGYVDSYKYLTTFISTVVRQRQGSVSPVFTLKFLGLFGPVKESTTILSKRRELYAYRQGVTSLKT